MDLNLLSANVNRLLANIWAVISLLREFTVDEAKDVSIIYINADGSESVKIFSNIAKMNADLSISGSNANGNYVKFADGALICFGRSGFSQVDLNLGMAGNYRNNSESTPSTFPITFVGDLPIIQATIDGVSLTATSILVYTKTLSDFLAIAVRANSATNLDMAYTYIAIGRWK